MVPLVWRIAYRFKIPSSHPKGAIMSKYKVEELRNIVLVGHGAAGKTSLADQMLFLAGEGTRAGSVDDGTSQLDVDLEERQRHFSISSAMAHLAHHGCRFNVIDTPGYPEFVGQAISALCAAETALVVVNAGVGVEANTQRTFELAGRAELARMIVCNKLDHENLDLPALLSQLREAFGPSCLPLNVPNASGAQFQSVSSLLSPDQWAESTAFDAADWGRQLLDTVVEADDELMERYLNGEALTAAEVMRGVTKAILAGTLTPVFFLSAKTGVGVRELMDALVDFGLSPGVLVRQGQHAGQPVDVVAREEGPLVARVFKTRIDPFVSKMSFIRVYSGKLTRDSLVQDARTGRGIKIHQLLDVQGGRVEAIDEAHAGDLVAVAKIEEIQLGDTLVDPGADLQMPQLDFPQPMVGLAVEPKSRADQQKISGALHKIEEEDPTFHVVRDPQTHELVMNGLSELHLQIVQERLHQRDKVDVVTHPPRIPYRETIAAVAEGSYRHKKQSGGAGQFAEVHLRVFPLAERVDPAHEFTRERYEGLRQYNYDPELNFAFLDCVSGGSVPNQFIPAVEKGVRERMEQGVLGGFQMQGLAVALFFGKDHPVDSNEAAFRTAASHCLQEVCQKARPVLLEPAMRLSITVPVDFLGEVSADLNTRRGSVQGIESGLAGKQVVQALVPLSELSTYGRSLSSLTGGQGSFVMELAGYQAMSPQDQHKVLEKLSAAPKH
jgi:elongation factor G